MDQGTVEKLREIFDSLHSTIVTDPKDWSLHKRDAWLYGILVGWDDCLPEIQKRFNWSDKDVSRLQKYRSVIASIKGGSW